MKGDRCVKNIWKTQHLQLLPLFTPFKNFCIYPSITQAHIGIFKYKLTGSFDFDLYSSTSCIFQISGCLRLFIAKTLLAAEASQREALHW